MPTPRIEKLNTERIARIMTVALKEFADHSYESSSFNRIIRSSGMSKGTMYYYFESKQDVFITLLKAVKKEFQDPDYQLILKVNSSEEFWQHLKKTLDRIYYCYSTKPALGRFLQNFLTKESRLKPNPASPTVQQIEETLTDIFMTGQLVGAIRRDLPIELIICLTWSLAETFFDWLEGGYDEEENDEILDKFLDLFKRTLSCREDLVAKDEITGDQLDFKVGNEQISTI